MKNKPKMFILLYIFFCSAFIFETVFAFMHHFSIEIVTLSGQVSSLSGALIMLSNFGRQLKSKADLKTYWVVVKITLVVGFIIIIAPIIMTLMKVTN